MPAASLSKVATLGALRGHEVEVRARGSRPARPLDHVARAGRARLRRGRRRARSGGERRPRPGRGSAPRRRTGPVPASPGSAIGPARSLRRADVGRPRRRRRRPGARVAPAPRGARGRPAQRPARSATAPPARSARPRPRSSTPTCCCSTTPTCSTRRAAADRRRAAARRAPGPTAVAAVEAELAALPDPYLRARAPTCARCATRCCASSVGVVERGGRPATGCWSPPT